VAAPRNILDVPTGTGRVIDYLKDQSVPITAVDRTSAMLAQAARHVRVGMDTLLLGNAASLPFLNGSFDCVISLRFFHLFDTPARTAFAREFGRILTPGGHLLLSMTNGWYGGGINWLKHYMGAKTVHFEHRGELQQLFPNWTTVQLQGNYLPLQGAMNSMPVFGPLLRWSTTRFPTNRLCWERFYLLKKP
jgi:ubiquinone/menaquinone biosynthesis C-methylase UbiE